MAICKRWNSIGRGYLSFRASISSLFSLFFSFFRSTPGSFFIISAAILGGIVGFLKAYCNVNEVISGIMLNWIGLYTANTILTNVKEVASPYTLYIKDVNPSALLPVSGLSKLFNNNSYVTIAVPLAFLSCVIIALLLSKTSFGYELKATGNNRNAARYACMINEKRNML